MQGHVAVWEDIVVSKKADGRALQRMAHEKLAQSKLALQMAAAEADPEAKESVLRKAVDLATEAKALTAKAVRTVGK